MICFEDSDTRIKAMNERLDTLSKMAIEMQQTLIELREARKE